MCYDANRIKHLEMIQAVIGRLGNDSFLIKGWAVTVTGAFLGFAVESANWRLSVASVVPTLLFWGLDTSYLRSERLFRTLYDHVRTGACDHDPFFMGATTLGFIERLKKETSASDKHISSWKRTFCSQTLKGFYLTIVASALVVSLVVSISGD